MREIIENIKNEIIVCLIKKTHLYSTTIFSIIEKVGANEMIAKAEEIRKG